MLRRSLALAIVMCAYACVEPEESASDGVITIAADDQADLANAVTLPEEVDSICDHLPAEPPCSLLCDHDALVEEYVPESSCAVFLCSLTDGRTVVAHACHPAP